MNATIGFANTPEPPYDAVVLTRKRAHGNDPAYGLVADRMVELGSRYRIPWHRKRPWHCLGITVSYWRDETALLAWKRDTELQKAQRGGREAWYDRFEVRIARVERAYGFAREPIA